MKTQSTWLCWILAYPKKGRYGWRFFWAAPWGHFFVNTKGCVYWIDRHSILVSTAASCCIGVRKKHERPDCVSIHLVAGIWLRAKICIRGRYVFDDCIFYKSGWLLWLGVWVSAGVRDCFFPAQSVWPYIASRHLSLRWQSCAFNLTSTVIFCRSKAGCRDDYLCSQKMRLYLSDGASRDWWCAESAYFNDATAPLCLLFSGICWMASVCLVAHLMGWSRWAE